MTFTHEIIWNSKPFDPNNWDLDKAEVRIQKEVDSTRSTICYGEHIYDGLWKFEIAESDLGNDFYFQILYVELDDWTDLGSVFWVKDGMYMLTDDRISAATVPQINNKAVGKVFVVSGSGDVSMEEIQSYGLNIDFTPTGLAKLETFSPNTGSVTNIFIYPNNYMVTIDAETNLYHFVAGVLTKISHMGMTSKADRSACQVLRLGDYNVVTYSYGFDITDELDS